MINLPEYLIFSPKSLEYEVCLGEISTASGYVTLYKSNLVARYQDYTG